MWGLEIKGYYEEWVGHGFLGVGQGHLKDYV